MMQVAKTACLYFLMCIYVADMEDSSRLEAVEDAVIGIQTSLRSIEAFTRNLSELQRQPGKRRDDICHKRAHS